MLQGQTAAGASSGHVACAAGRGTNADAVPSALCGFAHCLWRGAERRAGCLDAVAWGWNSGSGTAVSLPHAEELVSWWCKARLSAGCSNLIAAVRK